MSHPSPRRASRAALLLRLGVLLVFSGCAAVDLDTTYGKRRGSPGAESVNGTAVLANLFEAAGHRVTSWRRLSPKLAESDVIVWFPDSFAVPSPPQCEFLEEWLSQKPERVLIYVGRDYDAATAYWKRLRPLAPPTQAIEVARRAAVAQALHDERRANLPKSDRCDWFTLEAELPHRQVVALDGPWAEGIDPRRAEIELDARFASPSRESLQEWDRRGWAFSTSGQPSYEKLLFSGEDPLVIRLSRSQWNGSQILVVTNGSFLLNLPLVNHEHRKLAGKLIGATGPAGRTVFLESDDEGPPILDKEPGANAPTGFEVFTVWPIGVILLHITALGILACIALFPVFGRPRELPIETSSDFGQHVAAQGELLEMTGDREYAMSRIRHYQEQLKHASTTKRTKSS